MRRFFVDSSCITEEKIIITLKSDISHIVNVLRMKEGDSLLISDMTEYEYTCTIDEITKNEIVALVVEKKTFTREPELSITLFQGIPKSSKMETIIQKCIELGVNKIVPFVSLRTAINSKNDVAKSKYDRWCRIAAETVKQCRRGIIPEICKPIKLDEITNYFSDYDLVIVLYELEDSLNLKQALKEYKENQTSKKYPNVAIIIGSEGGLEYSEIKTLVEAGTVSVTVGKTILRTETAGPAAIAMLFYEFELDE